MLVDANLLLYARNADDPRHDAAAAWLTAVLNGPVRIGLPWQSMTAFLRIATNPRAFPAPLDATAAWDQVREWIEAPASWVPTPGPRHALVLGELVTRHAIVGPLVTDAVLAALALEHGTGVYSTDADFARFQQLRWEDPLRAS